MIPLPKQVLLSLLVFVFPTLIYCEGDRNRYEQKLIQQFDSGLAELLLLEEIKTGKFIVPSTGKEKEKIALELFHAEGNSESITQQTIDVDLVDQEKESNHLDAQLLQLKFEKLRKSQPKRNVWSFDLSQFVYHDSNVTQVPDGTTLVSGRGGAYSNTYLQAKSESREWYAWGQTAAMLSFGETRYFKQDFEDRDSRHFSFALERNKEYTRGPLMMQTTKISYRSDFLKSAGDLRRSFDSYGIQGSFIFKPTKKLNSYSDFLIPLITLGLENRDYSSRDELDSFGRSNDTFMPSLTALCINIKNKKKYRERSIAHLDIRKFSSDSNELDYTSYRLGASYARLYALIDCTLNLSFAYRDQADYQSQSRRDDTGEIGLLIERKFSKDRIKLGTGLRYTKQSSNQTLFSYDNTRLSMGVTCDL